MEEGAKIKIPGPLSDQVQILHSLSLGTTTAGSLGDSRYGVGT